MIDLTAPPSRRKILNRRALLVERLEARSLLTAGMLDPTFGEGGKLTTNFEDSPPSSDYARASAVQADGKIVVAGYTRALVVDAPFYLAVVRYNADGSLDSSFGTDGFVTMDIGSIHGPNGNLSQDEGYPAAVAIQSDGKIVTAYSSFDLAGWDFAIARLNTDGNLDSTFNGSGKQSVDFGSFADYAYELVVQTDGKIAVAGSSHQTVTGEDFAVARLNADGSLDDSFAGDGSQTIDFGFPFSNQRHELGRTLAVQSDGKLVVAGYSPGGDFDMAQGFRVARLELDGSLDETFANGGLAAIPIGGEIDFFKARAIAIESDDEVVLAGISYVHNSVVLLRLDATGAWASNLTFLGGYDSQYSPDVALQANGQILVLGNNGEFRITRLNSDLTVDNSFGDSGATVFNFGTLTSIASSVAVQPDGRIVVVGLSGSGTGFDFALARLTSDGIFDPPFSDADSDGIEDSIDPQPTAFSDGFNDSANGGATTGSIVSRGQQVLFVEDEAAPDGVLIAAHPLGGGTAATVSIEGGAAVLTLSAGDEVVATHGSVILHVLAGTVEATFTADGGEVATASLIAGNGLTFEPQSFTFIAPDTNTEPVQVVFDGAELTVNPGETVAPTAVRTVTVDIQPESLSVDSNGLLTVVVFGAADFSASQVDVGSVQFAGAVATQWVLVDANQDGRLDLQLKFRREETDLDEIYAQLLADDSDGDGVLDSTRQTAEVSVTGQTLDDVLFSGSDSINMFLAGRSLRELLARLFG